MDDSATVDRVERAEYARTTNPLPKRLDRLDESP
jgi:hypothetical protein